MRKKEWNRMVSPTKKRIPAKDKDAVYFSGRFIRVVSRLLVRRFIRGVCLMHAERVIRKARARMKAAKKDQPLFEHQKKENMPRRLQPTDRREWYSVKDVEEIYGISRRTLERIRKSASAEGAPLKISKLPTGELCSCWGQPPLPADFPEVPGRLYGFPRGPS